MKITGLVKVEAITDVSCDVCGCSTRMTAGGYQYGTLQAHWGMAATTTDSDLRYTSASTAFFRPWRTLSKSDAFSTRSVWNRQVRLMIWAWLPRTITSRTQAGVDWSTIDQPAERFP